MHTSVCLCPSTASAQPIIPVSSQVHVISGPSSTKFLWLAFSDVEEITQGQPLMALQLAVCPGQVQAICARGIDPNLPCLFLEISMFNCVRQEGNNGVHSKHSSSKLQCI